MSHGYCVRPHKVPLLCSPGLVAPPQVVDVDDESGFILTDHVPDFALVNPLVLLQEKKCRTQTYV